MSILHYFVLVLMLWMFLSADVAMAAKGVVYNEDFQVTNEDFQVAHSRADAIFEKEMGEADFCEEYSRFLKHDGKISMCWAEKPVTFWHWSWGYAVRIPCALWAECLSRE